MLRSSFAIVLLTFVATACGNDDQRAPSPGNGLGGSGAGGPMDAAPDTGGSGGAPGDADVPDTGEAGTDGSTPDAPSDALADGPGIACLEDPVPAPGQGYCVVVDGDGFECNPITSEPCNVSMNETCEFDGARFRCINAVVSGGAPCGVCGIPGSEYCTQGFTCRGLGGKCTRYCCDTFQCAFGTVCVMQPPTGVGICQATSDTLLAGFAGAVPDGGTPDSGAPPPQCVLPPGPGNGSCIPVGDPAFPCNPVTNTGCNTAAGEACDFEPGVGSSCVAGSHDANVCEPCTAGSCKGGLTCYDSPACVRFCCSDAECSAATCQLPSSGPGPGICVIPNDGGSS